jgi:hypothetical protein
VFTAAFVADGRATVAGEPGGCVRSIFHLYRPSRSFLPIPRRAMRGLIALVGSEASGSTAPRTTPGIHRRNHTDHRLEQGAVVGIAPETQRAAEFRSNRTGRGPSSPSCPDRLSLARSANLLSSPGRLPRPGPLLTSPVRRRHRVGQAPRGANTPAATRVVHRRCTVGTVTPNESGRWRHANSLVSTHTIAVNTARVIPSRRCHIRAGGGRSTGSTVRLSSATHPVPTAETSQLPCVT